MAGIEDIYLSLFDSLQEKAGLSGSTFPYTDIYTDKKQNARIDIALPGYQKELISVRIDGTSLIVIAKAPEVEKGVVYVEQGILKKSVKRVIRLSSYYQDGKVTAVYKDGILSISVEESEHKPSNIKILGADDFDEIISKEDVDKANKQDPKDNKESKDDINEIMNILKSDKGFMEYFNNLDKDKFMKDIESSLEELRKNLNSNTSTESARPSPTEEHTEQPNPVNVG
jgi:hypothetical protein